MKYRVRCDFDGAVRHGDLFDHRYQAHAFAEWGHLCTNAHTIETVEDGGETLDPGALNDPPTPCGVPIPYPREGTGRCERIAGHGGMHRRGLAAIESDERDTPPVGRDEVLAVLTDDTALTVMEVAGRACGTDAWRQRGNVRNRLYELESIGAAICDENRPQRWMRPAVVAVRP